MKSLIIEKVCQVIFYKEIIWIRIVSYNILEKDIKILLINQIQDINNKMIWTIVYFDYLISLIDLKYI